MTKPKKRPRSPFKDERSADLHLWIENGYACVASARLAAEMEVSIGRTNSERAMGFVVGVVGDCHRLKWTRHDDKQMAFVLDRDQVVELIGYLQSQLSWLRKPLGRGSGDGCYSWLMLPELRLQRQLENAAMKAHPGWRQITKKDERDQTWGEIGDWVQESGAPDGEKLIKWFKRTHPHKVRRIERDFTKRLWAGKL